MRTLLGFGFEKIDKDVDGHSGIEIWFRVWRIAFYWGADYEKKTGRHQLEEMGFNLNEVEDFEDEE